MKLETERLILRKPKLKDIDDLVEACNNKKLVKYLCNVPYPYKKKDAKYFIEKMQNKWKARKQNVYCFLIELKSEKKVIGNISINNVTSSKVGTTGSWINEKYWRQGFITEAKIAINDYAFDKLGLRKLKSNVYPENLASNRTQLKMGYKLEGLLRKEVVNKVINKIYDVNSYGLLKSEWKKKRGKLIKDLKQKFKKNKK